MTLQLTAFVEGSFGKGGVFVSFFQSRSLLPGALELLSPRFIFFDDSQEDPLLSCDSLSVLHTKSQSVDITLWNHESLGRTRALLRGMIRIGYNAERRAMNMLVCNNWDVTYEIFINLKKDRKKPGWHGAEK